MPVHLTDDPAALLAAAGGWLATRPREHDLLPTMLDDRAAEPRPGHYGWAVDDGGRVAGLVFQSPPDFNALVAAATPPAVADLAGAVARGWDPLPEDRRRGYGAAVTAAVSRAALAAGTLPVLYTQLANPTSNAVYRRLGYEPVLEALRYSSG